MGEGDAIVWASLIAAVGAIILSAFTAWSKRAEEASVLTGDALEMYKEVKATCAYFEKQIDTLHHIERGLIIRINGLEVELASTKRLLEKTTTALKIAEANIEFLIEYMKKNGLDIPDLKFRDNGE